MKRVFYLLLLIGFFCAQSEASEESCVYVTKGGYPMASSEEDLDVFRQGMSENNAALWLKLRQEGRGWMSEAGDAVCIVEAKGADKVKIRPEDSTREIWTVRGALEERY